MDLIAASSIIPKSLCECGKDYLDPDTEYWIDRNNLRLSQGKGLSPNGQISRHVQPDRPACAQHQLGLCFLSISTVAACTYVTFTRLYFYWLQAWLQTVYIPSKHRMNTIITIPTRMRNSLTWCKDHGWVCVSVPFLSPTPNKMIIRDASLLDRGTQMDSHMAEGTWTPREARMHVNLLELWTVREACKAFLHSNSFTIYS